MYKSKLNIISTIIVLTNINITASDDDSLYFHFEPDSINLEIGDSINVKVSLLSSDGSLSKNQFLLTGEWGAVEVKPWISNPDGIANVKLKVFKPGSFNLNASNCLLYTSPSPRDS